MKKIICLLVFICIPSLSFANGNALSLFVKAADAYKQADYAEAVRYYEEILDSGQESGALYFNLGNAYYKGGELGKAILNYKRAQNFIPRDSDLRFNQKYAGSFVKKADRSKPHFFEKIKDGHIHFYTTDEMILILTLSVFALGMFFLLSRFFKWTKNIRYTTRWICVSLIIVSGIGLVFKVTSQRDKAILLTKTPAFFEPAASSTEHFQLYVGMQVQILGTQEDWIKVKRSDGRLGWIPDSSVEAIQ